MSRKFTPEERLYIRREIEKRAYSRDTNKQIAADLGVSRNTVDRYRADLGVPVWFVREQIAKPKPVTVSGKRKRGGTWTAEDDETLIRMFGHPGYTVADIEDKLGATPKQLKERVAILKDQGRLKARNGGSD